MAIVNENVRPYATLRFVKEVDALPWWKRLLAFPLPPKRLINAVCDEIEARIEDEARYQQTIALPRNPLTEALLEWFESYGHCNASCDWNNCYPQIADEVGAALGVTREHIAERWSVGTPSISSATHDQVLAKYQQLRQCRDQGCVKCIEDVNGLLGAAGITISG